MVSAACAAQSNQFGSQPEVQLTGGRVTGLVAGTFQNPPSLTDLFYVNQAVLSGTSTSVAAGILLNQNGQGFERLTENQIVFSNVANVVAMAGNFLGTGNAYAFALTPATVTGTTNLCIYAGAGATLASQVSAFGGGNAYPPSTGNSGCMTLQTLGSKPPQLAYIAAFPLKTGPIPQLMLEDAANNFLNILSFSSATASAGLLSGVQVTSTIQLAAADGAGPIYVGDLNGDGNTDFIVNGQTGYSATVYLGNGDGTFKPPVRYVFAAGVRSMLMHDMDGDGILDMVIEDNSGSIEIHHGKSDGTFAAAIEGGTVATGTMAAGYGGHLAAINSNTLDILTATPIGLSLLRDQGGLSYALKAIYNIGAGRTSFALADLYDTNSLDLAVDSAEGVAIVRGNPDGTFQTSYAYSALAPALSMVVGVFRNANLSSGIYDAVVGTGSIQGQLLQGQGDGTFTTAIGPTDPVAGLMANPPPANLWSNILPGDFDGDGKLDLAYSLTGLPLPAQGSVAGPGLYVQYGNGDGTFENPTAINPSSFGAPAANTFYGESASGFFDADGITDIANIDSGYVDTLRGQRSNSFQLGLNATASHTAFDQVAVGLFNENRGPVNQDLVLEQGTSFTPYANKQDGAGTNFTVMPALTGPGATLYPATVLLADVDGDGNDDLVVTYYNSTYNASSPSPAALYIWYGNGDGTFQSPQTWSLSRNFYLGAIADMNGDGKPDIVLSDGSLISILYNLGGRSFGTLSSNGNTAIEQHFVAGQGINAITLADVNGDGHPDVVVANGGVTISNAVALGGGTASSIALTPNPPDLDTGGITVLVNHATTATTTQIFMCIGPTVLCPVPPGVAVPQPPHSASLPMYYGQIWNGIIEANAADGSTLTGTLELLDAYAGPAAAPPSPLCTLTLGVTPACQNSVGTTQGTSVGVNVLTGYYLGDATHTASTSEPTAITVLPDLTTQPTLTGAPNRSPLGQPVTFTATLTGNYAAPTGPVSFVELFPPTTSASLLGTAPLVPGTGLTSTAIFTTTTLALGTDSITASYAATQNFDAATFPSITETITPSIAGAFTLTVTPATSSVGVGYSTLLTVTAAGQNGFSQGVNLSCSNLPSEVACFFDTASLPAGGGTTSLVVGTTAPHSCGTTQPYFLGFNSGGGGIAPFALPAIAGVLALFLPGRKRWLRSLIALAVVATATQMTGCGNCTDLGTRPATYTFQVSGTSTGTSEVQSQPVTITVTI